MSASTEFRPAKITSKGPRRATAAARARAVARVSAPAKAVSVRWKPASAPKAMASRQTVSALGGPMVNTLRVPPLARAIRRPTATPRRQ